MRFESKRQRVRGVPDRWKHQYYETDDREWYDAEKKRVYEEIKNIVGASDDPRAESIDLAIGNSTWTDMRCWECDRVVDAVVIFEGMESHHEVGRCCLSEALGALPASADYQEGKK